MKHFEYKIYDHQIKIFFDEPIRCKEDVIRVLILAIQNMHVESACTNINCNNKITLLIDYTSRIFFSSPAKVYSIVFPFGVQKDDSTNRLIFNTKSGEVNSQLAANVLHVLNQIHANNALDLASAIEECDTENQELLWSITKDLLLYEEGYMRFDHDSKNKNGDIHPLDHLDIFYSQQATFKLGLNEKMSIEAIIDLLSKKTSCHFLHKKSHEKTNSYLDE